MSMVDRIQFFFDESGKSDLSDSSVSGQDNLILAGFLVAFESPFWDEVKVAWERASNLLKLPPHEIELHAWQIYGGKSIWDSITGRLQVLDPIFEALKNHQVPIYWTGLPVEKIATIDTKAWERILIQYLSYLNDSISVNKVEVYGDHNSWVTAGNAIQMDAWSRFENNQAEFCRAKDIYGIQVADVIAHTVYRSNKQRQSNTDKQADKYREMICGQFIHLPNEKM
jgi:hypothetical protein